MTSAETLWLSTTHVPGQRDSRDLVSVCSEREWTVQLTMGKGNPKHLKFTVLA